MLTSSTDTHSHSPGTVAVTIPLHFGPAERPLFGCLHWPTRPWSGMRVVLCAPLGYEGQFAYLGLRELAVHLAETTGAIVLRFDYDGCGDSAGTDEDTDRVARWLASIDAAIDEIKLHAPSGSPVVLIGLRAGALLAATAAAARSDIGGLVLWAPCRSGRLFLREQRAFAAMAFVTATADGAAKERWGERGFEANGYVFSDEAAGALETLDLKALAPPAPHILVLDRAEIPGKGSVPESWRVPGVQIEQAAIGGYTQFMEPPWLSTRPVEALTRIGEWVGRLDSRPTARAIAPPAKLVSTASPEPGMIESAAWYDPAHERFGVLSEPVGQQPTHALILVTSTYGYRIGPNRMNVAAARQFAKQGFATLRIDLAGIGEIRAAASLARARPPHEPYHLDAIEDVRLAVNYLKRRGYTHIALCGVCAGAFLAWYTAVMHGNVSQVLAVNPRTFLPMRFGRKEHMETTQAPLKWSEQLRAEKHLSGKLRVLSERAKRVAIVAFQHLRARLPLPLLRSRLAGLVHALGRQRAQTTVIFSTNDFGIVEYRREIGPKARWLEQQGFLREVYIDGPDHSFTPRWANRMLIDSLSRELSHWSRRTRREESWRSEQPTDAQVTQECQAP